MQSILPLDFISLDLNTGSLSTIFRYIFIVSPCNITVTPNQHEINYVGVHSWYIVRVHSWYIVRVHSCPKFVYIFIKVKLIMFNSGFVIKFTCACMPWEYEGNYQNTTLLKVYVYSPYNDPVVYLKTLDSFSKCGTANF